MNNHQTNQENYESLLLEIQYLGHFINLLLQVPPPQFQLSHCTDKLQYGIGAAVNEQTHILVIDHFYLAVRMGQELQNRKQTLAMVLKLGS